MVPMKWEDMGHGGVETIFALLKISPNICVEAPQSQTKESAVCVCVHLCFNFSPITCTFLCSCSRLREVLPPFGMSSLPFFSLL